MYDRFIQAHIETAGGFISDNEMWVLAHSIAEVFETTVEDGMFEINTYLNK